MRMWFLLAAMGCAFAAAGMAAGAVTLADKPVTATITVPESVRRAAVILLHLDQVTTPKSAAVTWNIFAELPTADVRTSVEHPNFIGYVTVVPNPSAPKNPPKGFTIQIPEGAARFLRKSPAVRLTFVPAERFAESGVTIGSMRLEAVKR